MEVNSHRNSLTDSKSLMNNPLDKRRDMSDRWFAYFWIVVSLVWVVLIIDGLTTQDTMDCNTVIDEYHLYCMLIMEGKGKLVAFEIFFQFPAAETVMTLLLTFSFVLGFLIFACFKPYICYCFGARSLFVLLGFYVLGILFSLSSFIESTIFLTVAITYIQRVGIEFFDMSDIVEKTARLFFRLSYLLIFSFFIHGLVLVVIYLTIYVIFNGTPSGRTLIVLLSATYLVFSIYCFGLTVLCQAVATHECTQNDEDVENMSILSIINCQNCSGIRELLPRCITTTARYHLGTIAYAATVIGPFISACIAWNRTNKSQIVAPPVTRFERILDVTMKVYLLFYMPLYALIITAIDGRSFTTASEEVFRLFKITRSKAYAFVWVFYGIKVGVLTIIIILMSIPLIMVYAKYGIDMVSIKWLTLIMSIAFVLNIFMKPVTLVIDSIGITKYLCKLRDEAAKENTVLPLTA